MGFKKKWKDSSDERLTEYLFKVEKIVQPIFKNNGRVDLSKFDKKGDVEYLLALILNCRFSSSDDIQSRSFGADNIIAIQLDIENNEILKYWGKINWLSTPIGHECHRSYQDPLYGEFKLDSNGLEVERAMFGDYDKSDLDSIGWINTEMNWMYDL